jgi:Protein of unknown function (DUF2950)
MTPALLSHHRCVMLQLQRAVFAFLAMLGGSIAQAQSPAPVHESFDTAMHAVRALVAAAHNNDINRLLAIFGPGSDQLVESGDPVADKRDRANFVKAYHTKHVLIADGADRKYLVVGASGFQMPTPLVRRDGRWEFDGAAGADELVYRRIGRDELGAIAVCKGIVDAENDYAAMNPEKTVVKTYAAKLMSDPGHRNGLYWEAQAGEPASPAGPFLAKATEDGYVAGTGSPYHGYYYRILTAQGPSALGGAMSYLVDGAMTGGFAAVAWPALYRANGVMTLIVGQDGVVYQKDLGDDTEKLASSLAAFDPDSSWVPAEKQP